MKYSTKKYYCPAKVAEVIIAPGFTSPPAALRRRRVKGRLRVYCIVFLSVLMASACYAQKDAIDAVQKIYTAYNTAGAISFTGRMKMYAKNNPAKIIEKMHSSYTLEGRNFSCSIGPVQMLLNENYYVSADKTDKLIMIGYKKNLSETAQLPVLNIEQFKTWIKEKTIEATVIQGAALPVLQLTDLQGITGYNLYRITYNPVSGYMKNVILETADYNDAAHKTMVLEIDYTTPVRAVKAKTFFSEKPFFTLINNKIQVTGNYKGYQLINQL